MWFTQKCNETYEFAVVVLSLVVSLDAPLFFDRPIPVKEFILMICGQNHHLGKKFAENKKNWSAGLGTNKNSTKLG